MKKSIAKLCVALLAIAAAPVLLGCGTMGRRVPPSTVAVSGFGVVRAQPDTVRMDILLRYTAATTRRAQEEVNGMVRQAMEILQDAGVEDRNIATMMLRFSPEYDWGQQGRRFLGQRAEQAISFTIDDIDSGGRASGNVSDIIDRLIGINGIELQGMHFSVRNTAELHSRARELAYRDALEKARQYAGLSGQRIVRAITVAEEGGVMAVPRQTRAAGQVMFAADAMPVAAEAATMLPAGEVEIFARILVEFLVR